MLNKIDLFKARLATHRLSDYLPSYPATEPNTYEATTTWLIRKIEGESHRQEALHIHLTCATDQAQVQVVLFAVSETIFRKNWERSGLL